MIYDKELDIVFNENKNYLINHEDDIVIDMTNNDNFMRYFEGKRRA